MFVLTALIVFIVVNLIIWCIKYGWMSNYAQLLNNKDWSMSISQLSIQNPVSIFYDNNWTQTWDILPEIDLEDETDIENIQEEISQDIDPYDPEFEDEFNSFFGWEETQDALDINEDIEEEYNNIEDDLLEDNSHSVAQRLIQKFNE